MSKQIQALKNLLDEVPILEVYAKDLGYPYNMVLEIKIWKLRGYLEDAISKEINKANNAPKTQTN